MLEQYFKTQRALVHSRPGPAGPFLEGFAEVLAKEQFGARSVENFIRGAAHLGAWMASKGLAIHDLDDIQFQEFVRHLAECSCFTGVNCNRVKNRDARTGVRRFLSHLRSIGVVSPSSTKADLPGPMVDFEHWLLLHRGLRASTVVGYRPTVLALLRELGNPANFTVEGLRRFVAERSVQVGPKQARKVLSRLKVFLRFLANQGQCSPSLVDGIPPIAHWRLTSLPAYLPKEDVEKILKAPDLSKPIGLRDRAILLLLARLGLRAGDVAEMRLEDLDWTSSTLAIHGKERRPGRLPLPQEVGDALLEYLTRGRAKVDADHVFLSVRAPFLTFRTSRSHLSRISLAAANPVCSQARMI